MVSTLSPGRLVAKLEPLAKATFNSLFPPGENDPEGHGDPKVFGMLWRRGWEIVGLPSGAIQLRLYHPDNRGHDRLACSRYMIILKPEELGAWRDLVPDRIKAAIAQMHGEIETNSWVQADRKARQTSPFRARKDSAAGGKAAYTETCN